MHAELKITSDYFGIKDTYTIEVGTVNTDALVKMHSLRIRTDEGTRYGKVEDAELEVFAIKVLQMLGYKIKPLDPLI